MKKNQNLKQLYLIAILLLTGSTQIIAQSQQYLHFDGENDRIEIPEASQYIANGSGLSLTGWFYCDALAYGQGMFGFRNGGTGDGEMYMIQLGDGKLENRYIPAGVTFEVVAPNFTVLPEVWQHYAWVYDGSAVTLYLDGEPVGSTAANGSITSMDTPFSIGNLISPWDFFFNGRIDEVSVWSKGLTQGEIQAMMSDELTGNEANLELYYKFNQGIPNEDNTAITKLKCEVGSGERDGDLYDFTLMGTTSNFGGELDNTFQAISFPQIPNKLITDVPFNLEATASSGLEVEYQILSGPATVNGSEITLDGTVGEVVVEASQPGDGTYDAAVPIVNSFQVLDPNTFVPVTDARCPLNSNEVWAPELGLIQLASITSIDYPDLFEVDNVVFEIDGTNVQAKDWGNDHYTGWWTPPAYGNYTMNIIATNNYGASSTESVNFTVVDQMSDVNAEAADEVLLDINIGEETVTAELPCYLGAFDQIIANLDITCPEPDCDPWDRISGVEVKDHTGEWYEIIRYITPYGIACNHSVDLTDFMSALQGKVDFRFYLGTQGDGFLYSLDFDFNGGIPTHKYSTIDKLWYQTYNFGDPDDLQPTEAKGAEYPSNVLASKIKLVSTGHGWGPNNTGNAAEFHEDTHHIWVNGSQTFAQHNWQNCDPNPDGCNDQNGTWEFSRAGWCPGSIAPWFDYDMTSFISGGNVDLRYIFNEDYIDLCHPNNPDCVNGVTCDNCNEGFNPHLIVASYLISLGDEPLDEETITGTEVAEMMDFKVYPNPTTGTINVEFDQSIETSQIRVLNSMGQAVRVYNDQARTNVRVLYLQDLPTGIYFIELNTEQGRGLKKVTLAK